MSQKATHGDKKGAKTTSHKGQPKRGSSATQEESKASQTSSQAKLNKTQRLRKNLNEEVRPDGSAQ